MAEDGSGGRVGGGGGGSELYSAGVHFRYCGEFIPVHRGNVWCTSCAKLFPSLHLLVHEAKNSHILWFPYTPTPNPTSQVVVALLKLFRNDVRL